MVYPAGLQTLFHFNRHQYPLIHTLAIRVETLQSINGRQVKNWIIEGHQLTVDQIPVTFRAVHGIFRQLDGVLYSGIGQWIGGASSQYAALRNFQGWESGWQMIEPAPCGGRFNIDGLTVRVNTWIVFFQMFPEG